MKNRRIMFTILLPLFLMILFTPVSAVAGRARPYVPEQLQPWIDWVLHDKKEQIDCIPQYDDPAGLQCAWPGNLDIQLDQNGGSFCQSWQVFTPMRIPLPGNRGQWPQGVTVDGLPVVVLEKLMIPVIRVEPGSHEIKGRFAWSRLPEFLQIPPVTALVILTVDQKPVTFPAVDASGRLWVKKVQEEEKIENRFNLEIFRMIDDNIPAQMTIHANLDVAGSARALTLGPVDASKRWVPLSIKSSLPAKFETDGYVRLQVRPGRHYFSVVLRHEGPLSSIDFHPVDDGFWPAQEIWSFNAHPGLRRVEVSGVPAIDPLKTTIPEGWRNYPAYRVLPGQTMGFKEIRRGDPLPAPDQLSLDRKIWLRFDGSGFTFQDTITGKKSTGWRLEMSPAITLGRVSLDGVDQYITKRHGKDKAGVELRNGVIRLTGDSAYQGPISSVPAVGWDHRFQKINGTLFLPPGWKLLYAQGMDIIHQTWMGRWTLLDLFVVLIFMVAVASLFSKSLAGIGLVTMVLIFQEPGAPKYVWLFLLSGIALLKHLPAGKFRKMIRIYQYAVIVSLVGIAIPYSVQEIRVGLYPQLAKPWISMNDDFIGYGSSAPARSTRAEVMVQDMATAPEEPLEKKALNRPPETPVPANRWDAGAPPYQRSADPYKSSVMQYDPSMLNQTGPGIPSWQPYERISFGWSGPVEPGGTLRFLLAGPRANCILAFLRVGFIIILGCGLLGIRYRKIGGLDFNRLKAILATGMFLFCFVDSNCCQAEEVPSQEILRELQHRLLKIDDCFPQCAAIGKLEIFISPDRLIMDADVDLGVDAGVPFPGDIQQWHPDLVLVDTLPAKGLYRDERGLWVPVPEGKHRIHIEGRVRRQNTFQLSFPLKPNHLFVTSPEWIVEGLYPDGSFDTQIQFKRVIESDKNLSEVFETGMLPPFVLVERTLLLGLVWKVETVVRRVSPTGSAIVLNIPLIQGESVVTDGIHAEAGIASVSLQTHQDQLKWESFLEPSESILLRHKQTKDWTEQWQVDVSPVYHMEYQGIPVILHQVGQRWHPTWHPWPGEEVRLTVTRPPGVEGKTLTVEKSLLESRPGRRTTDVKLSLWINSSQGVQHDIVLPQDAQIQEISIQGRSQPVRHEGSRVSLPLVPGMQMVEILWSEPIGTTILYRTSSIDLGTGSVNARMDIYFPPNRWPLFLGGDALAGPAVLFWSVLIVLGCISAGLARTKIAELKFYQWFLLGIGMSMSSLLSCLIVVGWLFVLDIRGRVQLVDNNRFNLVQIGIAGLTMLALGSLVAAISQGLIGHPDMNIIGNGSRTGLLRWYQDVSPSVLPRAWVISVPMAVYRVAMLFWALWISFWLIRTLKWGWRQFSSPSIWGQSPPDPDSRGKFKGFGILRKKTIPKESEKME